ncbi:MAG: fumarylacetoacetate hydrolase family protein [Proteobacteria bacterium]|jgi:2-keto-4-pentenoate hydratase/2-oxohepta-3-ene-1,7-dioic acid hydratase in catechol pathway|nr:fumarylacetoacetate hydrolase family protein [Pseudomonadota bacterium]
MRHFLKITLFLLFVSPAISLAQDGNLSSVEPFKLGTFEIEGTPKVGVVLRDEFIVDLNAANQDLESDSAYSSVAMPADMIELISRYEDGLKNRLYELVNHLVSENMVTGSNAADYVYAHEDLHTMAPLMYPSKILNAAVNFLSHVNEQGTEEERAAIQKQRIENRGVPYLFLKPGRGAVIGASDSIVIPYGRNRTDWEVELGTVIGRTGKYISAADAQDYVFGYTVTMDISDRGGRPPGGGDFTSDWFVGKGHDTFAPMGPWIVPKEFYGDPMDNLRQTLTVDGEVMQDAQAGDMIHSLWELVEYASSIMTLYPGDLINNGTSGGTGAGTAVRGEQRFLQPGEIVEATIDGIGTMRMTVVGEDAPAEGSGSRLPAIDSYR